VNACGASLENKQPTPISKRSLQAHLEIETKQLMERGLPREQAEMEARRLFGRQFGSRALVMEATREVRGHGGFARLWQDIRYAARVLRRAPAFTGAAVLSLALGIGATTAVFSIADTIFLRPLPYADSGRLVWVAIRYPGIDLEFLPSPDYVAWRRDNRVFQDLAATQASFSSAMLLGGPDPVEVHAGRVSANFLDTFAVAPALGRTFRPDEELPNGPKAVVLTNQFWRDRFHGRRDVLGSTITLDGQPYAVIGVLPRSFIYPVDVKIDLLTTLPVSPTASHRDRSMSTWAVFGRLKRGVTMAQARADVDILFAASKRDDPQMFRADNSVVFQPLQEHRAGNVRTLLFILMGAAGCLLAIACANVANLLLARWSARARELAVRAAVGAGRGRLARQLFTEIALLIAAGTVAGMLLVAAALRGFVHFAAGELPRLSEVGTDFRVFGIALLVSLATALIFGGLPALRAGRVDLQSVLQRPAAAARPVGTRSCGAFWWQSRWRYRWSCCPARRCCSKRSGTCRTTISVSVRSTLSLFPSRCAGANSTVCARCASCRRLDLSAPHSRHRSSRAHASARPFRRGPFGSRSRVPTGPCRRHSIAAMTSACVAPARITSRPRARG
jgi:putative ABC transport system permease protein